MALKMLHTCIRVKNLEESMTFYQEVIGFEQVEKKDFPEFKFTLVYLAAPTDPNYTLELTYNYDQEKAYDLGNGYGHLAIGVDDLKESHETHLASGYPVTDLKGLPGMPVGYYFIQDPDGYKIEVIQNNYL